MVRDIIEIDEELCVGCGHCVPNCHQGALQVIDGKVRLLSDLMCEGLGACVGHCPTGAMKVSRREAEAYDEARVMEKMIAGGSNVIRAHLEHLARHAQDAYLAQAQKILEAKGINNPMNDQDAKQDTVPQAADKASHVPPAGEAPAGNSMPLPQVHVHTHEGHHAHGGGGCPGSMARNLGPAKTGQTTGGNANRTQPAAGLSRTSAGSTGAVNVSAASELRQWPVQLHLLNPQAPYFQGADVLLAADCTAFAAGGFHQDFLRGKTLAIACPKLDDGQDSYVGKIADMIDASRINTLTVLIMEVPCCRGLLQTAQAATARARRKVPLKLVVLSLEGEVKSEDWV